MTGRWVINETIYQDTNQEYEMKLQFSDCKLNHSSESQPHSSLLKDTSCKVTMWISVFALQVSFTAKFIVIPQRLKVL